MHHTGGEVKMLELSIFPKSLIRRPDLRMWLNAYHQGLSMLIFSADSETKLQYSSVFIIYIAPLWYGVQSYSWIAAKKLG